MTHQPKGNVTIKPIGQLTLLMDTTPILLGKVREQKGRGEIPGLNTDTFETELQELAGEIKVKVKLDNKLPVMVSSRDTDNLCLISLNPTKVKTKDQLNYCLTFAREAVNW